MKTFILICVLWLFTGCNGGGERKPVEDNVNESSRADKETVKPVEKLVPYTLVANYVVTDTGEFDFTIGNGIYAVVKQNNKLIDTIDKWYSFQPVDNGSYMYCKIIGQRPLTDEQGNQLNKSAIIADIGSFIVISNNKKINVNENAIDFGWFANPSIINKKIYYWGVREAGQTNEVFASEFDPVTLKTVRHYLINDGIESDDGGYFVQPSVAGDTIIYSFDNGKKWKFSKNFKPLN